jgi:hypothetical protein
MTYLRSTVLGIALCATAGCGSNGSKNDRGMSGTAGTSATGDAAGTGGSGGATGGSGGASTTGGSGGTNGTAGTGGATGTGGAGGTQARDCFPECVAALRRNCERPAFGAGSCAAGTLAGNMVYCYSNGVRETRMSTADGGVTTEFTQTDGQTVCYRVVVTGTTQSFQTPAGQEVAQAVSTGGNMYAVTCGGTIVTVDISDPSCRTLNSGDCTSGACP